MNTESAIEIHHLVKRYGKKKTALDDLSLSVPTGSVFAFLGRNGAGKTTTIQILMNQLDRTSGDIKVLGLDPRRKELELKRRIGYVAENQQMYPWMTLAQLCWFCEGFYPTWDHKLVDSLIRDMDLPRDTRMRDMSRGMVAKAALLLAMAHRPELLILDEPTSGLDVIVRREFLEGVIDMIQQEGRTVFFSTHLVHEVERIADWVGVIADGRLLLAEPIDDLKARVKRIVLTFREGAPDRVDLPGILDLKRTQRQLAVTMRLPAEAVSAPVLDLVKGLNYSEAEVEDLSLEDILVALVGKRVYES